MMEIFQSLDKGINSYCNIKKQTVEKCDSAFLNRLLFYMKAFKIG